MFRIVIRVSVFLALLYLACLGLQGIVDAGLKKSELSNYKEWNEILYSTMNKDVIIQGSSRASADISPAAIDSAFHVRSYNLGLDGYDFLMQDCRWQLYLERNKKPTWIIVSLDYNSFQLRDNLLMHYQFLPYLDLPLIREATRYYPGGFDFKDYYFPLYKYHNAPASVAAGIARFVLGKKYNNGKRNGFKAREKKWDNSFEEFKASTPQGITGRFDTLDVHRFERFLRACKRQHIAVILVYPPEYIELQHLMVNRGSTQKFYQQLSENYHVPYLDYSNDPVCFSTDYFYNSQHLNASGVKQFTKHLLHDLGTIGLK